MAEKTSEPSSPRYAKYGATERKELVKESGKDGTALLGRQGSRGGGLADAGQSNYNRTAYLEERRQVDRPPASPTPRPTPTVASRCTSSRRPTATTCPVPTAAAGTAPAPTSTTCCG